MKTCLLVDDSKIVRAMARRIMEELGFQVHEAENGNDALALCRKEQFTVVFLDWNMPVMDGLAFLQTLRGEGLAGSPKVIFCTTEGSEDFVKRGMGAGADAFLVKPFDKDAIVAKLAEAKVP